MTEEVLKSAAEIIQDAFVVVLNEREDKDTLIPLAGHPMTTLVDDLALEESDREAMAEYLNDNTGLELTGDDLDVENVQKVCEVVNYQLNQIGWFDWNGPIEVY